jgi:ABC-type glycerol-3-phosphate transport system substrate-binding protein
LTRVQGGKTVQWGTDQAETDDSFPSWIFGGELFDAEAYVTGFPTHVLLDTPAAVDGLQFLGDLIHKYKVQPTPAEAQAAQAGAPSLFQTGKIAMEANATWGFSGYAPIKRFEWGIASMPWPPKRYGTPRRSPLYPNQWMTFKNERYPEAAWDLQKWLSGPEGMSLWVKAGQGMPSRKSLEPLLTPLLKSWSPTVTDAEIHCVTDAVNHCSVAPSEAIVDWSQMYLSIIAPIFQKLQAGDLNGRAANQQMAAQLKTFIQQNPPPH